MNDQKKLRDIVDAIEAIEAYSVSSYDEFSRIQKPRMQFFTTCSSSEKQQIKSLMSFKNGTTPFHDWHKEYHCSWLRSSQIANCVENSSAGSGNLKIRNRERPWLIPIKAYCT